MFKIRNKGRRTGMNFCLFFILIYLGGAEVALSRSVKAIECPQEIVLQVFMKGGDHGADFLQLLPV